MAPPLKVIFLLFAFASNGFVATHCMAEWQDSLTPQPPWPSREDGAESQFLSVIPNQQIYQQISSYLCDARTLAPTAYA